METRQHSWLNLTFNVWTILEGRDEYHTGLLHTFLQHSCLHTDLWLDLWIIQAPSCWPLSANYVSIFMKKCKYTLVLFWFVTPSVNIWQITKITCLKTFFYNSNKSELSFRCNGYVHLVCYATDMDNIYLFISNYSMQWKELNLSEYKCRWYQRRYNLSTIMLHAAVYLFTPTDNPAQFLMLHRCLLLQSYTTTGSLGLKHALNHFIWTFSNRKKHHLYISIAHDSYKMNHCLLTQRSAPTELRLLQGIVTVHPCHYSNQAMGWISKDLIPGMSIQIFSFFHHTETECWDHPDCYPMATGDSFPGGKVAKTLSCSLTTKCDGSENAQQYLNYPTYP